MGETKRDVGVVVLTMMPSLGIFFLNPSLGILKVKLRLRFIDQAILCWMYFVISCLQNIIFCMFMHPCVCLSFYV